MREIQHNHSEFSQYYTEIDVIASDLDWIPSALRNAVPMGLCEDMKNSFKYSDMAEELLAVVMVCQKRDNQIRQQQAQKAAQNDGGGTGFASSPRPPAPQNDPAEAPTGIVAGYTTPAPMDPCAGR